MNDQTTSLTFLDTGRPTGVKFVVEHGRDRALVDVGIEYSPGSAPFALGLHPRPGHELQDLVRLGVAPAGTGVLGEWDGRTHLFVSHLHLDHAALVRWVAGDVPLFYPAGAEDLRQALHDTGYLVWRVPAGTAVEDRGRVAVGDIEVEFVAVDHDLPGATGFVIRTPDLSIAYTGDHRWHGMHPELTEAFALAARGADVLIQEAVAAGLEMPGAQPLPSEGDLVEAFEQVLERSRGLAVLNIYPMNRERVAAFGQACARRGRTLLMEPRAARVAGWPHVIEDPELIRRSPELFCLQNGFERLPDLLALDLGPGTCYVHSNGTPIGRYDPAYDVLQAWVRGLGLEYSFLTSSGHSRLDHIRRMVETVGPGLLVPVHSRHPELLEVPGVPRLLPENGRRYSASELLRAAGAPS